MSNQPKNILVVDDDPNLLQAISLRLKMWGYEVSTAYNGAEALTLAEIKKPDLIITDIWMPAGTGFSLAYRLKESFANIPVIFLSASKQANLKRMAKDFDGVAFLEKPYEPEVLRKAITDTFSQETLANVH